MLENDPIEIPRPPPPVSEVINAPGLDPSVVRIALRLCTAPVAIRAAVGSLLSASDSNLVQTANEIDPPERYPTALQFVGILIQLERETSALAQETQLITRKILAALAVLYDANVQAGVLADLETHGANATNALQFIARCGGDDRVEQLLCSSVADFCSRSLGTEVTDQIEAVALALASPHLPSGLLQDRVRSCYQLLCSMDRSAETLSSRVVDRFLALPADALRSLCKNVFLARLALMGGSVDRLAAGMQLVRSESDAWLNRLTEHPSDVGFLSDQRLDGEGIEGMLGTLGVCDLALQNSPVPRPDLLLDRETIVSTLPDPATLGLLDPLSDRDDPVFLKTYSGHLDCVAFGQGVSMETVEQLDPFLDTVYFRKFELELGETDPLLDRLQRCRFLRIPQVLDLSGVLAQSPTRQMLAAPHLTGIRDLTLGTVIFDESIARSITTAPFSSRLESLAIILSGGQPRWESAIDYDASRILASSEALPALRKLKVAFRPINPSSAVLTDLGPIFLSDSRIRLSSLTLAGTLPGEELFTSLIPSAVCASLAELDLSNLMTFGVLPTDERGRAERQESYRRLCEAPFFSRLTTLGLQVHAGLGTVLERARSASRITLRVLEDFGTDSELVTRPVLNALSRPGVTHLTFTGFFTNRDVAQRFVRSFPIGPDLVSLDLRDTNLHAHHYRAITARDEFAHVREIGLRLGPVPTGNNEQLSREIDVIVDILSQASLGNFLTVRLAVTDDLMSSQLVSRFLAERLVATGQFLRVMPSSSEAATVYIQTRAVERQLDETLTAAPLDVAKRGWSSTLGAKLRTAWEWVGQWFGGKGAS